MSIIPDGYSSNQKEASAQLASKKKLEIGDLKIIALLELSGQAFYSAAASATEDKQVKALLMRNGQEEFGHAHRLQKAIRLKGGEYELPNDEDNPFIRNTNLRGMINSKLLASIKQAEIDGDLSYQGWADAEDNQEIAKIYRQNGSEELSHRDRIEQIEALLS